MNENNDFYIGWMAKAPVSYAKHVRKVIIGLLILIVAAAVTLSLQQKKFSTASFEFGQLTEVTGIYHSFPVPSLKVITGHDAFGHVASLTMPLVGYGKFGAEGVVSELEKEKNLTLENKEVKLKGTLLYSDGKTLLQIDNNDSPLLQVGGSMDTSLAKQVIKDLGNVVLTGEILDPKCYFGVMKPGHGKPHRDCAIRCIAGGMDPVLWVRNKKGEANYYLILDSEGKKMNETLKDYIADPVSVSAKAVQYDDWVILYVNSKDNIKRLGGLSWFKSHDGISSCGPSTE